MSFSRPLLLCVNMPLLLYLIARVRCPRWIQGSRVACPSLTQIYFFHAGFGIKNLPNNRFLPPPLGLAPPPLSGVRNPGFATGHTIFIDLILEFSAM